MMINTQQASNISEETNGTVNTELNSKQKEPTFKRSKSNFFYFNLFYFKTQNK